MTRKSPIQIRPISQYVLGMMRRAMRILEATKEAGRPGEEMAQRLHRYSLVNDVVRQQVVCGVSAYYEMALSSFVH